MKETNKVKVGLLLESNFVAAWQLRIIEIIEDSDFAEITALVVNGSKPQATSSFKRLLLHKNKLVWKLHEWLDNKLLKPARDPFKRVEIPPHLNKLPKVIVNPRQTKFCDYLENNDYSEIKKLNLDVALRFGFRILKGDFLKIAKTGVWSYHHADNRMNRGTPPGYWEVMNKESLTGVTLQILEPELDGGIVLEKSWSATHKISIARNKAQIYWKAVQFIPRKLKELNAVGHDNFIDNYKTDSLDIYDNPLYLVPKNFAAFKLLIRHLFYVALDALSRFWYKNQWVVLYGYSKNKDINPRKFFQINPPSSSFWADTFAYQKDGRNYIYLEEFPYKTSVGILSVIEVDKKGNQLSYQKILEKPYHLSYPFVFEQNNALFMIPETAENRTVDLYRCDEIPAKWSFYKTIMKDVLAVDSTTFKHNNKWWMFTTIQEEDGASKNEELFLFFADEFDSDNWTPHPLNPILSDVRGGRMGGRIIEKNGKLYRPGQNGAEGYGASVMLFEIDEITEEKYKEHQVDEVKASWNSSIFRTHTLDMNGEMIAMDGLRKKRRWF